MPCENGKMWKKGDFFFFAPAASAVCNRLALHAAAAHMLDHEGADDTASLAQSRQAASAAHPFMLSPELVGKNFRLVVLAAAINSIGAILGIVALNIPWIQLNYYPSTAMACVGTAAAPCAPPRSPALTPHSPTPPTRPRRRAPTRSGLPCSQNTCTVGFGLLSILLCTGVVPASGPITGGGTTSPVPVECSSTSYAGIATAGPSFGATNGVTYTFDSSGLAALVDTRTAALGLIAAGVGFLGLTVASNLLASRALQRAYTYPRNAYGCCATSRTALALGLVAFALGVVGCAVGWAVFGSFASALFPSQSYAVTLPGQGVAVGFMIAMLAGALVGGVQIFSLRSDALATKGDIKSALESHMGGTTEACCSARSGQLTTK